jgi:hypothetical protein
MSGQIKPVLTIRTPTISVRTVIKVQTLWKEYSSKRCSRCDDIMRGSCRRHCDGKCNDCSQEEDENQKEEPVWWQDIKVKW